MPWFSKCCGVDEYICQECVKVHCSKCNPSHWEKIIGKAFSGNVCPKCFNLFYKKGSK